MAQDPSLIIKDKLAPVIIKNAGTYELQNNINDENVEKQVINALSDRV